MIRHPFPEQPKAPKISGNKLINTAIKNNLMLMYFNAKNYDIH